MWHRREVLPIRLQPKNRAMKTILASVCIVSLAVVVTAKILTPSPMVTVQVTVEAPQSTPVVRVLPPPEARKEGKIPDRLRDDIVRVADLHGFDPAVIAAVAYKESGFDANVCSDEGACGLMQFMPATARQYRVDRSDPVSSLEGAGRYLAYLKRSFGNEGLALAAYNWGEGNVRRWLAKGARLDKAPLETRDYVLKITGRSLKVWAGRARSITDLIANVAADDYTVQMRNEF